MLKITIKQLSKLNEKDLNNCFEFNKKFVNIEENKNNKILEELFKKEQKQKGFSVTLNYLKEHLEFKRCFN